MLFAAEVGVKAQPAVGDCNFWRGQLDAGVELQPYRSVRAVLHRMQGVAFESVAPHFQYPLTEDAPQFLRQVRHAYPILCSVEQPEEGAGSVNWSDRFVGVLPVSVKGIPGSVKVSGVNQSFVPIRDFKIHDQEFTCTYIFARGANEMVNMEWKKNPAL